MNTKESRMTNELANVGNALLAGAAWVLVYTGLPAEPGAILVVLMTIDFFTGIAKARRLGHPVTSWRIKSGVVTKCCILAIPLVIALAAKGLGADFIWLVDWAMRFLILSEAYSVIANSYTARTGVDLPEWDATAVILRKLRGMLDGMERGGK
jgi:phage-related holin